MTIIYKGITITGSPTDVIRALKNWDGFTSGQSMRAYRAGMRKRAQNLYGKRLSLINDRRLIHGLADIGELYIISE
jgi:hypothetical protein